jgi:hypothetical protein
MNAHLKHAIDSASIVTVLGTLAGWLPSIAALLTIVWTALRIYESKTVQGLVQRWRAK